jgi:hypothetical protein
LGRCVGTYVFFFSFRLFKFLFQLLLFFILLFFFLLILPTFFVLPTYSSY